MHRLVIAALALAVCGCAPPVEPDLVITNARVFTNDTSRPWAEAVAIKGDRIVAVGGTDAVAATAGPATRRIDAGGRVVVPGFNDARVDLPLEAPPTPTSLAALDRTAITQGVTSLQVIAGGPMRTLVEAARLAQRHARWRLIRSPMDGERPQDEEPFLPPQPGERLVANGVAWAMPGENVGRPGWPYRTALSPDRLDTVVRWAYGAEDPIVLAADSVVPERHAPDPYLAALSSAGMEDVWRRKRPRLDVRGSLPPPALRRAARLGVVITFVPAVPVDVDQTGETLSTADAEDTAWLKELRAEGVHVAMGSGRRRTLLRAIADGESWRPGSLDRRPIALEAATLGSAYAEKAERDKGWLGPGTLADIAILSDDIFTVPTDRIAGITSVLTMVGGAIVYDPGVLPR